MKTNKKIDAMVELANNLIEEKPFDAVNQAHFLGMELCGYHKAHSLVEKLEKEIENARNTRSERKSNIDKLLVEMFNNNVTMVRGAGMSKCPIRIELTNVLTKEKIAKGTRDNILTAISYSLHKKKPYNIHFQDDVKAEREAIVRQLENDYLVECIKRKQDTGDVGVDNYFIAMNANVAERAITEQWDDKEKKYWIDAHKKIQTDTLEKIKTVAQTVPSDTTTPPSDTTTPPSDTTTPPSDTTTPPSDTTTPPIDSRKQYINDARKILDTLVGATQVKRALGGSDKAYYDAILASVNDIYETLKLMTLDKDVSKVIDDIQDDDSFDDDDLQIDSELVD